MARHEVEEAQYLVDEALKRWRQEEKKDQPMATEHTPEPTQKHAGFGQSMIAAALAAAGASGISIYFSPGSEMLRDPTARPDPYTGTMHQQYAQTVDAKFDGVFRAIAEQQRRLDECRDARHEADVRQQNFFENVIQALERTHHQTDELRKRR